MKIGFFGLKNTTTRRSIALVVLLFSIIQLGLYIEFVYAANYPITGNIFVDTNGNGTDDGAGDPGISRVTVRAWRDVDGNGLINNATDTIAVGATTDSSGNYSLSVPESINYLIDVYDAENVIGTRSLTTANDPQAISMGTATTTAAAFGYLPSDKTTTGTLKNATIKIGASTTNGPTGLNSNDQYGASVASIGDLNGDGVTDLVVGAGNDENGATSAAGAIFIHFMRSDGTISSTVKIGEGTTNGPTGLAADDHYGKAVTSIGDLNGDGVQDIVVGAEQDENGATSNGGAIFIHFMRSNGTITSTVKIGEGTTNGPTGLGTDDFYGFSVANIGDLNGDGVQDLAVGAVQDETGATLAAGAIFIHFMRSNGTITSTVKIGEGTTNGPTGLDSNDQYGRGIASIGDLNGDGVQDLVVGAQADEAGAASAAGAVYIHYMNANGSLLYTVKIGEGTTNGPTGLEAGDNYGTAVSGIGDLNNDGIPDILVGAQSDETSATSSVGAIYLHYMNLNGTITSTVKIGDGTRNGPGGLDTSDQYGTAVNSIGDFNGDGYMDMAVGARADETSATTGTGAIFLHFLDTIYFTLTYTTDGNGSITGSSTQLIALNGNGSTVTTTPNAGYVFSSWNDGVTSSSRLDTNVTLDKTYTASFTHTTSTYTVTESSGSTALGEAGSDTFTVVLNFQPASNVVFDITSSDTGAATVSTGSITFTTTTWDTPQTVTVSGVDDVDASNESVTITVSVHDATSDDTYDALADQTFVATITDNDTPAVTIVTSTIVIAESGTTATYTIRLATLPTTTVTIALTADSQSTLSTSSINFTTSNWDTPVTVTVTAVNDSVDEGAHVTVITHSASSDDTSYNGISIVSVNMTITDNDTAGVTVTQSGGTTNITEGSTTDSYTLVLTSQPTSNVTISIATTSQSNVSTSSIIFTTSNWDTPVTVTVTAVDDLSAEGSHAATSTHTASSADSNYNAISISSVVATVTDNDTAGITVGTISGNTSEAGGTATFTVVLNTEPTNTVTIPISSDDTTEGTISTSSLVFTTLNWNTPQTVTMTGVDDFIVDGNIVYSAVLAAATSADGNYNALNPSDVSVTNTDNDTPGVTITESSGGTAISESGTTDSYTIVLNTQPTASVTIAITTTTESNVSTSSIIFTTSNWNTAVTVTVTAVDDADVEGTHAATSTHSATSADGNYNAISIATVVATVTDNDAISYTLTYTANAHGTITGSSTQSVVSGSDGSAVTAVPDSGYQFTSWSDTSTANPRTDTSVSGDIIVSATFSVIPAATPRSNNSSGVIGCTDRAATNYSVFATLSNPSICLYAPVVPPVSTPIETIIPPDQLTCTTPLYLTTAINYNKKNNPADVRLLEKYLNTYENANIPVDGVYSLSDFNLVVKWQEKYAADILIPWNIKRGTGYVYITSLRKIKQVHEAICAKKATATALAIPINLNLPTTIPPACFVPPTRNLQRGDSGYSVKQMQQALLLLGFFSVTPNGVFGPITESSVFNFQRANGITQTGIAGPLTKKQLQTLTCR